MLMERTLSGWLGACWQVVTAFNLAEELLVLQYSARPTSLVEMNQTTKLYGSVFGDWISRLSDATRQPAWPLILQTSKKSRLIGFDLKTSCELTCRPDN